MVEGHTKPGKRDKYLLEQGFSLWSTIRAILTSPPLGRQKMPVSRCARLKNDRRGAKPGSTALPLFLALSHPLSFLPSLFVFLHLDPPLSCHPSPSRDDALSLLLQHSKGESPSLRRFKPSSSFFFRRFLFSAFSSLLQDSLDSLGDYVSCYYSSRGTPPRIPSSSPFLSLSVSFCVPSAFLLRRRCYSSSSAIDLLIFSRRIFGAR